MHFYSNELKGHKAFSGLLAFTNIFSHNKGNNQKKKIFCSQSKWFISIMLAV